MLVMLCTIPHPMLNHMNDQSSHSHICHIIIDAASWKAKTTDWEPYIAHLAQAVLDEFDWPRPVEVNIKLTDNAEIQELNRQYRGKDKPTNVLSFPALDDISSKLMPPDLPLILGDIALAYETIEQEAIDQNKVFDHHVSHLVVHGLLHLIGYDHETDAEAEAMESLEIDILKKQSISNPYKE